MPQVKVLLVQLAAFGDCLLVTPIAKQIKEVDYPGCHLSWLIGSKYAHVLKNNPFIDEIIELFLDSDFQKQRDLICKYVTKLNSYNNFKEIFITDYTEVNFKNWYGTTRSSLFRSYPHQLKIDPQPLIYLDDQEKRNISEFCTKNNINGNTFNILFECSPQSGQSSMTTSWAKQIAEKITTQNNNIKIILSSNQSYTSSNLNIIDGSKISYRENAELTKYCHLLVGCSSGISWLCTSNSAKKIPIIQVVNPYYHDGLLSASMRDDFRYFGLSTSNLIELYNPSDNILLKCIIAASNNDFLNARKKYNARDNHIFTDSRFLKESKITNYKKLIIYIILNLQLLNTNIYTKYKKNKPKWFTPKLWINKLYLVIKFNITNYSFVLI